MLLFLKQYAIVSIALSLVLSKFKGKQKLFMGGAPVPVTKSQPTKTLSLNIFRL